MSINSSILNFRKKADIAISFISPKPGYLGIYKIKKKTKPKPTLVPKLGYGLIASELTPSPFGGLRVLIRRCLFRKSTEWILDLQKHVHFILEE